MTDSEGWSPTMNLRYARSQCGHYSFLHQQFTRGDETEWRRVPMARDHDPNPDPSWRECPFDTPKA